MVHRFNRWGDFRLYYFPKRWFRVGSHVFFIRGDAEQGQMTDVSVFSFGERFSLERETRAAAMRSVGRDRWALTSVVRRHFSPQATMTREEISELELVVPGSSPDTFRIQAGRPELMRVGDLIEQMTLRARVGLPTLQYAFALQNRFAYPLVGFAASMLVMALALRPQRRGHLTVALVEGLVVIMFVFSLLLIGRALVLGEHLASPVAAWSPVVGLLFFAGVIDRSWLSRAPR
jgi:lipopolysaccharide export system permease protein